MLPWFAEGVWGEWWRYEGTGASHIRNWSCTLSAVERGSHRRQVCNSGEGGKCCEKGTGGRVEGKRRVGREGGIRSRRVGGSDRGQVGGVGDRSMQA